MTRGNARELAVHLIYGCEFTGETPTEVISTRLAKEYYDLLAAENEVYSERPTNRQIRYLEQVVSGVVQNTEALNEIIGHYSIGWDVRRISRLTRCIMQVAIFEIMHIEDVPDGVAVSEAVRLAKKYDAESGPFVNGILGSFVRSRAAAAESVSADCMQECPLEEDTAAITEEV